VYKIRKLTSSSPMDTSDVLSNTWWALLLTPLKRLRGRTVPSVTWSAVLPRMRWRKSSDALRSTGKRKPSLPLGAESGENITLGSTILLSANSGE
jgi:hypothetical protein